MRVIRQRKAEPTHSDLRACFSKQAATRRRRQRDVLCEVMLSASECATWLTLEELAKLTHYPPASISAQLRHLRKPQFGGYSLEKRPRRAGRILQGEEFGTVWEYRLHRRLRRVLGRPRKSKPQPTQS